MNRYFRSFFRSLPPPLVFPPNPPLFPTYLASSDFERGVWVACSGQSLFPRSLSFVIFLLYPTIVRLLARDLATLL